MTERRATALLAAGALLCMGVTRPEEIPGRDFDAAQSVASSLLASPRGQIREWSGAGSNRGEVTVGPSVDTQSGEPCQAGGVCQEPCRNVTYTFIGEDSQGRIVNNRYADYVCLADGDWQSQRALRATRTVLSKPPPPPETRTVVVERRVPAEVPVAAEPSTRTADVAATREVQRALAALLYYDGAATGTFDASTRTALAAFLSDESIEADDLDQPGSRDLKFFATRLRAASERGRGGSCRAEGRYAACGRTA